MTTAALAGVAAGAAYNNLVFAAGLVAFVVALAVLLAAGLGATGHTAGLVGEGAPHDPPYISTTALLGLPSPEAKVQQISKTIALSLQALTSAVSNE